MTTASQSPVTHKSRIIDAVTGIDEPLTRLEIATMIGIPPTTLTTPLGELVKAGTIFVRPETAPERVVRLGGVAQRRSANLYSAVRPVPQRTEPALCEGTMTNAVSVRGTAKRVKTNPVEAFITEGFNSGERREKVEAIRKAVTLSLRTVDQIADATKISTTFVRKTLAVLIEAGEVESVKRAGNRGLRYRQAAVLSAETAPIIKIRPIREQKAAETPKSDTVSLLLLAASEIESLRSVHVDLATEVEMLQARNAELETKLAAVRSAFA